MSDNSKIRFSQSFKESMIREIFILGKSVKDVSEEHGVSTSTLYKWRKEMITALEEGPSEQEQLVMDYIIALVNLQGVVNKSMVLRIYNEQNEEPIDMEYLDVFFEITPVELLENKVYTYKNYFVEESIFFFKDVQLVLSRKAHKPFYLPDKKELLRYVDRLYSEHTIYYQNFIEKLQKVFPQRSSDEMNDLVGEIQLIIKADYGMGNLFDFLMGSFERAEFNFASEAALKKILRLLKDLVNHTRRWSNNGYSSAEISNLKLSDSDTPLKHGKKQPVQEKAKTIGRNDPCFCGSGKKYKKCCLGKNETNPKE